LGKVEVVEKVRPMKPKLFGNTKVEWGQSLHEWKMSLSRFLFP
jgi:hypothetical protein